ncbi:relaxase domain-containing protein (plasmid) [Acinetobacter indicus]|uniref:relaxase domain-containing protein n=1 Tax=Acinetobacter indicus TaxID=756892 RepID=UPI001FA76945|nr:relaxase domain-containing protein [Acinetobacter indicus]UNW11135.1 relaxase domain-containing protein [Acinetobacter indicus]
MISLITLKSASQASNYYSKDNYYTQSNSIGGDGIGGGDGTTGASGGGEYAESVEKANWYGKGATALGLTDQENFNTDKFVDLLNGDIDENNQISKWVNDENGNKINKHRPGFDLTFLHQNQSQFWQKFSKTMKSGTHTNRQLRIP